MLRKKLIKMHEIKKKSIALLMVFLMCVSLTACGSSKTETTNDTDNATDSTSDSNTSGVTNAPSNSDASNDTTSEGLSGVISYDDLTADANRKSTANSDERYPLLTDYQSSDISSMEPINYINNSNSGATYQIFEPLFDRVSEDEYAGRLAKSGTWVDDTHYKVELYDYIKDTNGNDLTASDVVYSYQYYVNSGQARDFDYYGSVEATGDYEVTFTFTKAIDSLTAFNHMMTEIAIFTQKAAETHDFAKDPVGTGPYYLKEFVTGSHYELEANDNYWQTNDLCSDKCKRPIQTIHYDFISDAAMQLIAFQKGNVCELELQADSMDQFLTGENAGQYTVVSKAGSSNMTILPNMSGDSILSNDENLRLACFYALDTLGFANALGSSIYFGCTVDASPAMPDYQQSWNDIQSYMTSYDLDKAKEYLAKSSYNGETLLILSDTNSRKITMAQVMQGMLGAIGVKTEVVNYDRALIDSYASDSTYWDFYLYENLGSYLHTIEKLQLEYGASNGSIEGESLSFIHDDELQQMLSKCKTIDGYSTEGTQEILQYLIDNAYSYSTTYSVTLKAFSKDFADFGVPKTFGETPLLATCNFYLD